MSAADELLLAWASEHVLPQETPLVCHDRFGAVTVTLQRPCRFVAAFHSQEEALRRNLGGSPGPVILYPFDDAGPVTTALMRVPKSLELFEVYLGQVSRGATPESRLVAGFMTRHFTPRLLEVAGRYAATVTQSRAHKKARLLLLSDFHPLDGTMTRGAAEVPGKSLQLGERMYTQFYGVFSADRIDPATRFLLEQWGLHRRLADLHPDAMLDIGCGNGVIGAELLLRYSGARLLATDDAILAVASARNNLPADRSTVYYDHTLDAISVASQDLVVTNPPFHLGHENNIEVSLGLFRQAARVLSPGGSLVVVANRHLNYGTHLGRLFTRVEEVAVNAKFVIYRCSAQPKDL